MPTNSRRQRRPGRRSAPLLAVLALLAVPAAAGTLKVPQSVPTLTQALAEAQPGDTLLLAAGTYTGPFSASGLSQVSLRGKGEVVLTGGLALDDCHDMLIQGLTLASGAPTGLTISDCSDVRVRKLSPGVPSADAPIRVTASTGTRLERIEIPASGFDGIVVDSSPDTLISRCTIGEVAFDGIRAMASDDLRIERCTLTLVGGFGIVLEPILDDECDDGMLLRNRIELPEEAGIVLSGSGHLVQANRILDTGSDGIQVTGPAGSTGVQITRNRVEDTSSVGIRLEGTGQLVERNKLVGIRDTGLLIGGSGGHTISRNRITDAGEEGIRLEDTDGGNLVEKNRVQDVVEHGITIVSADNRVEKNKVSQAQDHGFRLHAGGNTLVRNKASQSGAFGLLDSVGGNTFEQNAFGSINPEGLDGLD